MRKKKQLLCLMIVFGVVSMLYYLAWWGKFYNVFHPVLQIPLALAVLYIIIHTSFISYIYLNARRREIIKAPPGLEVDVYIPTFDEPIEMVERTLSAALAIRYPHQTCLLDDGHKAEYRQLARRLGVHYLSRPSNKDHKAGNINYALRHTKGDIIAIFDLDHIPQPDFLDRALGHFHNPKIGFVQVMLSHYNQAQSFVAHAAADQTYEIFGPMMMGLDGCDCVSVFGSNSIFRRQALESVGGYKPGLTEDVHTSIHLHAAGWRSVYVPEVLAKGLVPADLAAFFKQQLKWSRGLFDVLRGTYPRLFRHLSQKQHIGYLTRTTLYFVGPVIAIHIFFIIFLLFQGTEVAVAAFVEYMRHVIPFAIMLLLFRQFAVRNCNTDPASIGSHFRGMLLYIGTWPVHTFSFLSTVLNTKIPFMATPKKIRGGNFLKLAVPQIITVFVLTTAIAWRINTGLNFASAILCIAGMFVILMHGGVFYAVWEGWRIGRREVIPVTAFPDPKTSEAEPLSLAVTSDIKQKL